jgi:AAA15 family ATPase/GTPase
MLLSFSLRNFTSYKDLEYIDFRPSSVKRLNEDSYQTIENPNDEKKKEFVYRTSAIFGANASGKSNIIFGLRMLLGITENSATWAEDKKISGYHPYKLSADSANASTFFEIEFIDLSNIKFCYSLEYDQNRIINETLDFYPNGVKANLFKRANNSDWKTVTFGKHYTGGVKQLPFFQNQTYLSIAGRSAGSPKIIRDVYEFLVKRIFCISTHAPTPYAHISQGYNDMPALRKIASDFIPNIGINADALIVKEIKANDPALDSTYDLYVQRITDEGDTVEFKYDDESDGTRHLIELLPLISAAFLNRFIVVVDELDSSLHCELAILLIRIFNDPALNKHGSQLIFTSHNLQLMDKDIFTKEQIWFADKVGKKTEIYSLANFDASLVKNDSPFRKWYMHGKFGALPEINYSKISELIQNISNIFQKDKEENGEKGDAE